MFTNHFQSTCCIGLGASKDPCQEDYQGRSAMSETEVKYVDNYLKSELKRLVGYLDIHSYSQLWMIPWAFAKENVKDYDELVSIITRAVPIKIMVVRL